MQEQISSTSKSVSFFDEPGLPFSLIGFGLVLFYLEELNVVPDGTEIIFLLIALPFIILVGDYYDKAETKSEVASEGKEGNKRLTWLLLGLFICCLILDFLLPLPISLAMLFFTVMIVFGLIRTRHITIYAILILAWLLLTTIKRLVPAIEEVSLVNIEVWLILLGISMIIAGIISHFRLKKNQAFASDSPTNQVINSVQHEE